jgi:hypothetical protein
MTCLSYVQKFEKGRLLRDFFNGLQGANACAAEHREQLPKGEERMLPRGL